MRKDFSRRDFLRYALMSSGTFFVAFTPLKSLAALAPGSNNPTTTIDAAGLNKQAKQLFYQKKYAESIALYEQLIAAFPSRISYYDGYARALGAQQKSLEAAELYRRGLIKNASNAIFMHRLSLQMRNMCTGNKKAELAFVSKYGSAKLLEAATQLMIDAVKENRKKNKNKTNKGLVLDLRDTLNIIERQNKRCQRLKLPPMDLPQSMKEEITSLTSAYEKQWALNRDKHKPHMSDNADANIEKIDQKARRELYDLTEKKIRRQSVAKIRKQQLTIALNEGIRTKNTNKVEKYGMKILADQIDDTQTIGRLREHYRKAKAHDRLISLNRYLYLNNENVLNTLMYAHVLIRYDSAALAEAAGLLGKVKDYVNTLPPVAAACYYRAVAELSIKEGNRQKARTLLLEAIDKFGGKGGVSFSLLEQYANSYTGDNLSKGENLLKAMCGADFTPSTDDPAWKYVQNYIVYSTENKLSNNTMEQIKLHTALAKMQQKSGSAGYGITVAIINGLKSKIPHKQGK